MTGGIMVFVSMPGRVICSLGSLDVSAPAVLAMPNTRRA
jgi:hypothetical protein